MFSEAMENLQDLLAELEDIGATHDELDLLNDVLGAPEYVALGEVSGHRWFIERLFLFSFPPVDVEMNSYS